MAERAATAGVGPRRGEAAPVLVYVTSLRNPQNATDYGAVELLLRQTLRSLENQTDQDFRVVVVGHRAPSFMLPGRVTFVPVDFPAPRAERGVHAGMSGFVFDKGTKIGLGLAVARAWEPEYAMILDADDLVSTRLTEFVHTAPHSDGWVVDTGYTYSAARETYQVRRDFNRYCGSCHVVRFEHYAVPDLGPGATQTEIAEAFGERLPRVLGRHRDGLEAFAGWGVHLAPLPFRAVAYTVDASENHSSTRQRGLARPVTASFTAEFAVRRSRSLLGATIDGLGPRAVGHSVVRSTRHLGRRVGSTLARRADPRPPRPHIDVVTEED